MKLFDKSLRWRSWTHPVYAKGASWIFNAETGVITFTISKASVNDVVCAMVQQMLDDEKFCHTINKACACWYDYTERHGKGVKNED